MKDIQVTDNILEIDSRVKTKINDILKGREIDELSDEELVLLKNEYENINRILEDRVQFKQEKIASIKKEIQDIIATIKKK